MSHEYLSAVDSVTRRIFIRTSFMLGGALSSFCSGGKMISFDEAVIKHRDRAFGQRYIDQLVSEVLGEQVPTVFNSVNYDVGNELIAQAHKDKIAEQIADPRSVEEFRRKLVRYKNLYESAIQLLESDTRFAEYSPAERRSHAEAYLQTDEALMMLKKRFDRVSIAKSEDMGNYNASTIYNKYDFASGKKADLYVSDRWFRQQILPFRGHKLERPLNEIWLKIMLAHEYRHGLNFKNGIRLSPDLVIDNDARLSFDDLAFDFVDESMQLIEDLQALRRLSDAMDGQNPYLYLLLATYAKCEQEYVGLSQRRQLTGFEQRFIAHQEPRLNAELVDLPKALTYLGAPGDLPALKF